MVVVRVAADKHISGRLDFTIQLPSFSDIWKGDAVYEYPDFLSQDHVSDILRRVEFDKPKRHHYVDIVNGKLTDEPDYGIWCLGQNFWTLPNHPEFDEVFDPDLRAYMTHIYRDINLCVENFCKDYLQRTPEYIPGIATPGFNIVTSDIAGTYWHIDTALVRKMHNIDVNRIISINIPIQCDDLSHTEFRLSEFETYQAKFTTGSMLIWPGRKLHRFGCQPILKDHHRITYQCHIYDAGDRALIYF